MDEQNATGARCDAAVLSLAQRNTVLTAQLAQIARTMTSASPYLEALAEQDDLDDSPQAQDARDALASVLADLDALAALGWRAEVER